MAKMWTLVAHPANGELGQSLKLVEMPKPEIGDNEVLVQNLLLSVDPGQRTWVRSEGSYIDPITLHSPMPGGIFGRVIESKARGFAPGDLVSAMGQWGELSVIDRRGLRRIEPDDTVPATAHMSVLGPTGWTAYVGMIDLGKPRPGETLVVSAASGAVGSIAGQIGRIKGCRVIGIAGSPEKCAWLTEELGFDATIDYRSENVADRLDALCPDGIDVYFENVGGAIGRAAYARMAARGRIVLCGLVSTYDSDADNMIDLAPMLMKRVTIAPFVINENFSRIPDAISDLSSWLRSGELRYHVELVDGIQNAVSALDSLLQSGARHRGKLLVRVADDGTISDRR